MFDGVKLILALVNLTLRLMRLFEENKFIAQGEVAGARKTMELTREALQKAIAARTRAAGNPLDADGDGVPDDDGHRRD